MLSNLRLLMRSCLVPLLVYGHSVSICARIVSHISWVEASSRQNARPNIMHKAQQGVCAHCFFVTVFLHPLNLSSHAEYFSNHARIIMFRRNHHKPHYDTKYDTVEQCQEACLKSVPGCDAVNYDVLVCRPCLSLGPAPTHCATRCNGIGAGELWWVC